MTSFFLLLAGLAGALLPVQLAANTRMGQHLQQPIHATVLSFAVGLVAMLVISLLLRQPPPSLARLAAAPPWAFLAGVFGATYVACSIVLTPKLGVMTLTAAILAGQLIAAVILDHFGWLGVPLNPVTPSRLLGVALLVAGVILIKGLPGANTDRASPTPSSAGPTAPAPPGS